MQEDDFDGFQSNEEIQIEATLPHNDLDELPGHRESFNFKSKLPSAREISSVKYSLAPDMVTGWIPKRNIACPVPLNFQNDITDAIIKQLTSQKHQQVISYIGYRPHNTYRMHNSYCPHNYDFKYSGLESETSLQMINFFKAFYDCFRIYEERKFQGMNPYINNRIIFDSKFECGNLDCAVKVKENQYDLFIRIDANTNGHCLWYYFKIANKGKQKVRLNISNLKNSITLYNDGHMNPYYFSKKENEVKGTGWRQLPASICSYKTLRYSFLRNKYAKGYITYFNLSFDYEFQHEDDQVQFAYCIPYSYSRLLKLIGEIKEEAIKINYEHIKISKLGQSLSGIDIPLLTFGVKQTTENSLNKKCILISARIHPGQTNGSWMIQKIIRELMNYKKYARLFQQLTFKIVPMVNPDGVILGNYRSSCSGKDLNRCFFQQKNILYPEVMALKRFVQRLKQEYLENMLMFIDMHGHSGKKNVFLYGIDSASKNLEGRIFPKIISQKTEMFRYYSCNFKLKDDKKTTGRACFIKYFKNCYTIQSSMSCYFTKTCENIFFTSQDWHAMGYYILVAIQEYINMINAKESIKVNRYSMRSTVKSRIYKKRKKQIKKSETQDIYKILGVKEKKNEENTEFSPFEKYVQLFNMIKQDSDTNFQNPDETDSERQDYTKEKSLDFQIQLFNAKTLFQKAYKNCTKKESKMQYNYYYEKRYNREFTVTTSKQIERKFQELNPKMKRFSEFSSQKIAFKDQSPAKILNFQIKSSVRKRIKTTGNEARRPETIDIGSQKKFFQTSYQQNFQPKKKAHPQIFQLGYKPLTYNLRLLAPQNYIRPSQISKKKGYAPKRDLTRLTPSDISILRNQTVSYNYMKL